jgi:hypothetical protein
MPADNTTMAPITHAVFGTVILPLPSANALRRSLQDWRKLPADCGAVLGAATLAFAAIRRRARWTQSAGAMD